MSAKIFFASVITSILILAPVTYFVLPILYPNMTNEINGVVLQSEYVVISTAAYITDDELTFQKMDDTNCSITTQGDSSLTIQFSAVAMMSLTNTFSLMNVYTIVLVVNGVGNKTNMHVYYNEDPPGFYRQYTFDLNIYFDTGILEAGTYKIGIYWKSEWDDTGLNSLSVNHSGFRYNRSFLVQEIYRG